MADNRILNALTIDVEDWFHATNLEERISPEDWEGCEKRIVPNVFRILYLLAKFQTRATFFVLGWVAERLPDLILFIHDQGHEIASHGYAHCSIYNQSLEDFYDDIKKSKEILERITGQKILGYRALIYYITSDTTWAWRCLRDLGFEYDSSIFPVKHDRYGYFAAPRFPFHIPINNDGDKIIEFPLSTVRILGSNIPVAGGAYLRLFPYWFIKKGIKSINSQGKPAIIYFHPWEIDPSQPRQKIKRLARIRHYGNLILAESKLKRLLKDFHFGPVKEVLGIGA